MELIIILNTTLLALNNKYHLLSFKQIKIILNKISLTLDRYSIFNSKYFILKYMQNII
jgi:hypothetical protein